MISRNLDKPGLVQLVLLWNGERGTKAPALETRKLRNPIYICIFGGCRGVFYLLVVLAPITSASCCIVLGSRVIGARSLQRSLQS